MTQSSEKDRLIQQLANDPENVYFRQRLSELYFNEKKYIECIRELENIIEVNPDSFYAHKTLGLSTMALGKYEKAYEALKQALKIESVPLKEKYFIKSIKSMGFPIL